MRTTLTIDDHLAKLLKALSYRSGTPFKQVVNETLEAGLAARETPARARPYRVKPAALGGVLPGIDLTKALHLAAALEDEELARKLELRK